MMLNGLRLGAVALLVLSIVFVGGTTQAGELKVGTKAPAWILKAVDGSDVKSTAYDGKVVVLNFWATWCPPCVAEIPDFIELQKEFGEKGLTFVGVSLDTSSKPVKKYVKKTMVNYPVVMGDADVVKDFGNFSGIPQTYVIDKDGIIRLSQVGQISKEKLLAGIKPLL
jgi:peroxiredoxin